MMQLCWNHLVDFARQNFDSYLMHNWEQIYPCNLGLIDDAQFVVLLQFFFFVTVILHVRKQILLSFVLCKEEWVRFI